MASCDAVSGVIEEPIPRGVACSTGACDGAGRCVSGTLTTLPDDPIDTAPPLNPEGTFHDGIAFLYTDPVPVQTGVQPTTINPERATVITGTVLGRDTSGAVAPLPDVVVIIKDHPEYGGTITRADGRYDLVINGGGQAILDFSRDGYFAAQRIVDAEWGDWSPIDEVVLIAPDPVFTQVTFGSGTSGFQVATSSMRDDGDGARSATLLFQGGTEATVITNGQPVNPGTLTIRATEYTVADLTSGASGRDMMPGPLPAYSGYTYAVELSADEALDADRIELSKPVFLYVDNFLDFNVGETVPAGYFDRTASVWKASDNGRIIRLVGATNGRAKVTIDDANSTLATQTELEDLGITDAELVTLNIQFPSSPSAPRELWRTPVTHFTPWDCNWSLRPPECSEGGPCDGDPNGSTSTPDEQLSCGKKGGSIISCESRALGERLPIAGTGYSLDYRSDRTRGYHAGNMLRVALPPKRPSKLLGFRLGITYAGRKYNHSIDRDAPYVDFLFDPTDPYARALPGPKLARLNLSQDFQPVFTTTGGFGQAGGGSGSGNSVRITPIDWFGITRDANRPVFSYYEYPDILVGRSTGAASSSVSGLGGWSLSVHHRFEPITGLLHRGDGSSQKIPNSEVQAQSPTAFVPSSGPGAGPSPSILARPDGSVYFIDPKSSLVRRGWLSNGSWYFEDVTGGVGFGGDGGLALAAKLSSPSSLTQASDGSVFIADRNNQRIRRIDPEGYISTVAGTGTKGRAGDNGPATAAQIGDPEQLAVAPDGSIYFLDRNYNLSPQVTVRVIRPDGVIATLFGSGQTIDGWYLSSNFILSFDGALQLIHPAVLS